MLIQDRVADGRAVSGLPALLKLSLLAVLLYRLDMVLSGRQAGQPLPWELARSKEYAAPRWRGGRFRLCGMAPCSTGQKSSALLYCFAVVHS